MGKSSSEKWGIGLLLVFFSEEEDAMSSKRKKNPFYSSSSSTSGFSNIFRTTNSNMILTKTQSTISICALLFFTTFLLFTLSTFEPTISHNHINPPRRFLNSYPESQNASNFSSWVGKIWGNNLRYGSKINPSSLKSSHALQGMGTLFLRGNKAMSNLIVVHAMDEIKDYNERITSTFIRLLHLSGLTSKSDIVFLFSSKMDSSVFYRVIQEENKSFMELVQMYRELNGSISSFNETNNGEPIWGKKIHGNYSRNSDNETESTQYGSIVGFDADELDPENSLSGFLDHVPLKLRRWACYSMLLGRVRRSFKHIMLVEMKKILLLSGDPFAGVKKQSTESVFLFREKSQAVNTAVVIGGSRGVRRLAIAMVNKIVTGAPAMQKHGRKHPLTESGILTQLVHNDFILKEKVNFIISGESIPDTNLLTESYRKPPSPSSLSRFMILQRGNHKEDIDFVIMKQICSIKVESSVYRDCKEYKFI